MLKNIHGENFEVVGRRRVKLADGNGWAGILRQAYSMDHYVIGYRKCIAKVPFEYSSGFREVRDYAKQKSKYEICE